MSSPRIGRPDVREELVLSKGGADPLGFGGGTPHFSPRRGDPARTALRALAAKLEPLPAALEAIAKRVRQRIALDPRPGDDALVAELLQLRHRAFVLWLDLGRLADGAAPAVATDKNEKPAAPWGVEG